MSNVYNICILFHKHNNVYLYTKSFTNLKHPETVILQGPLTNHHLWSGRIEVIVTYCNLSRKRCRANDTSMANHAQPAL